ncbi:MAG: phosphoglycerate dehydrogenase [Proteobacteria bacterium]|nr:MAG: phosphoglycerate dehydrogenase [Pseudomonadota bacterium]
MSQDSLVKDKIKIVLLEGISPNALEVFQHHGYSNVECLKTSLVGDELKEKIKDAHYVGIRSRTQLTADVLSAAEKLVAIGCFCIGTNQVDLDAARERGIPVFNAPFSNTRSVAELVLGEALLLLRNIPAKSAAAHRGEWQKHAKGSVEARGKTLGIVGYGHIGTQLGLLAESLGMRVMFYDIASKLPLGNAVQLRTLDELLKVSDVVSLHVPQTPETQNMMGAQQFAMMKQGSVFINAARGTVVDIEALTAALQSEHLAGAAIDVFPVEPKSNDEEFVSTLRGIDSVILTPHIGGSTQEAQGNIGQEVAEKLVKYSDNGTTLSAKNFPEVSLPAYRNCSRLLHIHKNEPGILNEITRSLAEKNINIAAQYLQTDEKVGYVVIDVDAKDWEVGIQSLKDIPGTIRARTLR